MENNHIATINTFGYGAAYEFLNDYCCMGGSTIDENMKRFCVAVRECFMSKYLIIPSCADILHQMNINKGRG